MKVRFTPRALADLMRLKTWWHRHRPGAPDLLEAELDAALACIAASPNLGSEYTTRTGSVSVRRVLMPKTRNHVYYLTEGDEVVVVTVWGAPKRRGPRL